ncbi:glycosyltransferase [Clostridium perfringens]
MKKIIFITGFLSNGGSERVISVLADEFQKRNHDVSVITVYGAKNDYLFNKKVKIYPINHKSKNKFLKIINIILGIKNILKKEDPDVVISFDSMINIYTLFVKLLYNKKVIISERNDPNQYPNSKFMRKIRNFIYRLCDGIVFQTDDARSYFKKIIQDKSTIIFNPISSNLPIWSGLSQEKTIITASRLTPQKNLPMLINAFNEISKEFNDYKLKIFGEGDLYNELYKQINELNINDRVTLEGFSNDIHNEMLSADMFIITSNYEGISNSMLEALAIGVPVISTDSPIGGAKMFINNRKNGLLIKVGDTNELIKAMKAILLNKEFAKSLSIESQKIRKILNTEIIVQQWIEYIEKVCEKE